MTGWQIDLPKTMYFGPQVGGTCPYTGAQLDAVIREVTAEKYVAIDTETTGLVKWQDIPLYWSLAWGTKSRMTVHAQYLPYFLEAFKDSNKEWILANAKYDAHILANVGINLCGRLNDVQVMHALLYEDKPHRLKFIAQHILGWTWADFQDTFGKIGKKQSARDLIERAERENFDLLVEYAANDAWGTLLLYRELQQQLASSFTYSLFHDRPPYINNMWDYFDKIEVPFTRVLWKMERRGILVDVDRLDKARPEAEKEINRVGRDLTKIFGRMLNLNSPDQLRQYFIEEAGLPPLKWTKGGKSGKRQPSLDADFFEHYQYDHPAAKLVLEHREYTKLHGTYIVGLRDVCDPYGRIHSSFNQDVARCMPAGELVLTNRGYIPVESVVVGDMVITHKGRARPVINVSRHAPQTVYVVELSNGVTLRTTGNHQYKTGDGWRRADNLRSNVDMVVVHSEEEAWASIKGWDNYRVSSWGRIRNARNGHIITPRQKDKWGHLKVTLSRNGAQKRGPDRKDFSVHQLVAHAFLPERGDRTEVRHLDGIAWNNTSENLLWGTSRENTDDARRHGTLRGAPILTDEQVEEIKTAERAGQPPSGSSKLTFETAEEVRARFAAGEGRAELARELGVSYQAIDSIVKDRTWTKPQTGVSAEELAYKYGVSPAAIRDIWAGRRWNRQAPKEEGCTQQFRRVTVTAVYATEAEVTYGLEVEEDHSHVTGGVITHNTGRLSSSDPNLQNIPRPENDKWGLRDAFITLPGWSILASDYSQLEMRLLAAAAMEEPMIDIFRRGWDIHQGNASLMFDIPYKHIDYCKSVLDKGLKHGKIEPNDVLQLMQQEISDAVEIINGRYGLSVDGALAYIRECLKARNDSKSIGFGLNYGMGPGKLSRQINAPLKEAQDKIRIYKETYPAVDRFFKEAVEEGRKYGYSFTVLGRRRNIPMITSHRKEEQALGERLAVNTQIQGSAADVTKMAQLNLDAMGLDRLYDAHMLLQVHDELVFEAPTEAMQFVKPLVEELMAHPFCIELACPLDAEAGTGNSWGQAK